MYLVSCVATFTVLVYCIGTTVADCSYLIKHYDNRTATYREDIRYRDCRRTEECCGNYTDRRCCLLKSQEMTSPKSEGSQHAPALLLAGITTALIVIGVIAIFCWRLVCISAYKEASGARGSNLRLRRGQTSCIQVI
ncbi:uncharacterized protein LOC110451891 [Mizuhopecten yessoensis]|uniref:uncharacterized protein LOC110451891 n=1 Tax=Mizuhopecten yessoensis TaxID=6573 RepID=UPI000B459F6D|nr:uncharacterized protein LOC110451891 [Mizuhopecten yessoensis]